jgi:hypothetical protein
MEKVCRKLGSGLTDSLSQRTTSTFIAPPRQVLLDRQQPQPGRKPLACRAVSSRRNFSEDGSSANAGHTSLVSIKRILEKQQDRIKHPSERTTRARLVGGFLSSHRAQQLEEKSETPYHSERLGGSPRRSWDGGGSVAPVSVCKSEPDWHSESNVTLAAPYLQKILVDGEAIGAVGYAVFSQIIFDILAGWWPTDG